MKKSVLSFKNLELIPSSLLPVHLREEMTVKTSRGDTSFKIMLFGRLKLKVGVRGRALLVNSNSFAKKGPTELKYEFIAFALSRLAVNTLPWVSRIELGMLVLFFLLCNIKLNVAHSLRELFKLFFIRLAKYELRRYTRFFPLLF